MLGKAPDTKKNIQISIQNKFFFSTNAFKFNVEWLWIEIILFTPYFPRNNNHKKGKEKDW